MIPVCPTFICLDLQVRGRGCPAQAEKKDIFGAQYGCYISLGDLCKEESFWSEGDDCWVQRDSLNQNVFLWFR